MKRKTTLVKGFGWPEGIVQQVVPKPKTITICPLCKTRFKKGDPTVLVDVVKQIRIPVTARENNEPEYTIRIQVCEPCAQPIILQKQKARSGFIALLAERAVKDYLEELEQGVKAKRSGSG